jgi:hypothetical protein
LAVAWIGAYVFYVFLYIFAFCEREKKNFSNAMTLD